MGQEDNDRTKRAFFHDYHDRCVYLITVAVVDRKPLLGKVEGNAERAWITLSETGRAVWREIEQLSLRWPQIRVLQHQIMPDHVHLVLFVTERLPEQWPLGSVVAAWKHACGRAYSEICGLKATAHDCPQQVARLDSGKTAGAGLSSEATFRSPYKPLFSKGYNDSILASRGQLKHMMAYVRDNPRRLLIKRQHSQLFAIHRNLQVAGYRFDAVGNLVLLQRPMVAVHCRRHWSEAEKQAYAQRCLAAGEQGVVLIGAFISKAEKDILHEAQERKRPVVHLQENGFADLYKPVGNDFYACAEGRLLQLAPWPYHNDSRPISREQCTAMNLMAESVANTCESRCSYEKCDLG